MPGSNQVNITGTSTASAPAWAFTPVVKRIAVDTLGTSDSATGILISGITSRTGSDSLGTTDVASRGPITRVRTATDALGTTDAATRGIFLYRVAASDTLGTTDSVTRAPQVRTRTASDTLGTSDSTARTLFVLRTATDSLALSGYSPLQRDELNTDTRANYTSFPAGPPNWASTEWQTGGLSAGYYLMAAPVSWGNANDQARLRAAGAINGTNSTVGVAFVKPGSIAQSSLLSIEIAVGTVRLAYDGPWNIGGGVQFGNISVPSIATNTFYILEAIRSGNDIKVSVRDAADSTYILSPQTVTIPGGAPQTAYGAGVPLRPCVVMDLLGGNNSRVDWFEYSVPSLIDVATRGPVSPARTATDSLAPSGYTTAQSDLFSTDTRSSYTSFGNDSISWFAFSGGVWDSTGGGEFAYMAAPVGWGNASDTARVRTSGRHYNAHTFARQIVGFVKPGSVNTSSCFYMSLAGTGEVRITFNSQIGSDPDDVVLGNVPGLVAGNDYILEFTRNGNDYTATVKDITGTTVLFTQTNAIPVGQQAAYGSGISLRPMVGLQRSVGGGGEAEIYGFEYLTQPLLDVATRGPITFARTAADSLVTTDVATSNFIAGGPALRTATDTLGTSDAAVQIRILPRTATDSLGTSDVTSRAPAVRVRTSTDTLGTVDSATKIGVFARSASDTLGTVDTATRVPGVRIRSAADTLGTADAATKILIFSKTATDLLGTTDVATRSTLVRTRVAQDTLGTTDVAISGKLILRTASDSLGTADVATRLVTLARIASDALSTTDVATRIGLFSRTAVDTLGTVDVATRTRIVPRTASDILGTADTATRAPYTRTRTAVDTLGTSDTVLKGGVSALSAVDSLGTTDLVTRTAFVRKTGTDTLGTSDVVTRIVLRSKTATDTLGTSDVATRTRVAPRVAADTLGTSDVVTQTAFIRKTGTDTLGTSDAATRTVLRSRTAADTLGTSDAALRIRVAPRTATDTLGTSDVVTRAPRVSIRIASDILGTTDLVTGVRGKVRTATDTITLSDSASRALSVSRFALDTLGTTDVSVIFTVAARAAEDTLGTFDSAVGFPFYPLSSSDTLGTTDEVVVSVIYTRTGSDLLGTFDHATRVVIAGPEAFTGFRFLKSPGTFVSGTPGSFGGFGGFNPGKFTYKGN